MGGLQNITVSEKFAITLVAPPDYLHILGLIEVAEALHFGLIELGVDSIVTANLNEPGRRPVLLGANLLAKMPPLSLSPDTIIFNLEQMDPDSFWVDHTYLDLMRFHEVWDYSERNISFLREKGITNVRHVPLGYVQQLSRIPQVDKDIDVLFYGSMNTRREQILIALEQQGLNVVHVFGVYGQERDALIARAKVVLNIHFYESKIFEIVRIFYLLSNQVCVLSETGKDPMETLFSDGLIFASYDELVKTCLNLVADDARRREVAKEGLKLIKTMKQSVILKQSVFGGANEIKLFPSLPLKLNLGSGKDRKDDFLNIDINPAWSPDIVYDISSVISVNGLDFNTERFGSVHLFEDHFELIQAYDVLEHVDDLVTTMTNCLAFLKVGGIFKINVPYDLSYGAWQDPTHVRAFNEKSWLYYTDWYWYLGWDRWRFELVSIQYILSPLGEGLNQQGKTPEEIACVPRAVDSMMVELRKRPLTADELEMVSKIQPGLKEKPSSGIPMVRPEPRPARLSLVGISVVKNEGDIIESFVRHNLRFLDALLIVDNGSVDGTREILCELQREGLPVVIHDDIEFGHYQSRRMTGLFRRACKVFSPNFVFALDADEFIISPTRANLEDALDLLPEGGHGVLAWKTYICIPAKKDINKQKSPLSRMIYRRKNELPQYYKVVVSGKIDAEFSEIAEGNHSVLQKNGAQPSHTLLSGVALAHFPVRSSRQLSCKIISGWLANLVKNPEITLTSEAWHWHTLYDRLMQNPELSSDELALISLNYAQSNAHHEVDDSNVIADPLPVSFEHKYERYYVDSAVSVMAQTMQQIIAPKTEPVSGLPQYRFIIEKFQPSSLVQFGGKPEDFTSPFRRMGVEHVAYFDSNQMLEFFAEQMEETGTALMFDEPFELLIWIDSEDKHPEERTSQFQALANQVSKCILVYPGDLSGDACSRVWEEAGWVAEPFYTRVFRSLAADESMVDSGMILVPRRSAVQHKMKS
ncbi:MAG: glycosyltransferase family 2 protein [Pseudomonadota bacterium]|nr:glycosyltransferase family 2 protein [Pseudomonadota bacterium]